MIRPGWRRGPIIVHCPGCGLALPIGWGNPAVTHSPHGYLLVTLDLEKPEHLCPDPTTDKAPR